MNKNVLRAAVLGALLGSAVSAQAAQTILFDPAGGGAYVPVGSFDWLPGNTLAQDAVQISAGGSDPFQLWYQSSMAQILGPDGVTPVPFVGEYTLQLAFQETVSAGPNPANFSFTPGGANFATIYYDTVADADPITGLGYGASGTSMAIWSGVVTSDSSIFFVTNLAGPYGLLDQFGADDQGGILTVSGVGGGSTVAQGSPTAFGLGFFGVPVTTIMTSFSNTNLSTPFAQTNPSDLVVGNAPNYGASGVNGIGNGPAGAPADFHFQADANQSFAVPEPASLALMGLGLMGLGFASRRRRA